MYKVIALILLFFSFSRVDAAGNTFEVELHLGSDLLKLRSTFAELVDQGLLPEAQDTGSQSSIRKLETDLRKSFEEIGGYDLGALIKKISWGWLSSAQGSFVLSMEGRFEGQKLSSALAAAGWESTEKNVFNKDALQLAFNSNSILIFSKLSLREALEAAGSLARPGGWFALIVRREFLLELGSKDPRLEPLPQNISQLDLSCSVSKCELAMTLNEQTAGFLGSAMESLKMLLINTLEQATPVKTSAYLLDFWDYAGGPLITESVVDLVRRAEILVSGDVVSLLLRDPGSPRVFVFSTLPRFIFGASVHLSSALMKHRDKIRSLSTLMQANQSSLFQATNSTQASPNGRCEEALRLVRRAMDFYRDDYGGSHSYEEIKSELFAKSYLPQDLSCDGYLVRNYSIFKSNSDGTIQVQSGEFKPEIGRSKN